MEVLVIANGKNDLPINEQIRAKEVLVVGPKGEQVGVKNIKDALTLASYANLDLVLISPNANPPVCKVMDYNKFRYEKQKKQKEALKKQIEEIEKKIMEKNKEEALLKSRIASPYTDTSYRYKKKSIALLYILVIALVALVIFWSVKQVTVGRMVTTTASQVEGR